MRPPDSLWWSTLDEPVVPRASLSEHLEVDVAIVGGGFTGLWTARELKRRDPSLRVAVLEKSVCGFGASGRNGGWASALYPLGDDAVIARHGRAAFEHLRLELQRAVASLGASIAADGIDAHFIQGGALTFARSDVQAQRLRDGVASAQEHGYDPGDLTWLDEGAARERGQVSNSLGATYTPHCARLHPARLVRGLAEVDERLGVAIYESTTVTRLLGGHGATSAEVITAHASVHARFVVRATEGFTSTLPGERRSVAPIYSLMIATEPQPASFWDEVGFAHYETFADDRHLIIYGQRTNDDRLAFGGRGAPYHFASTVEERFDLNPKVFNLLASTLRELFPSLSGEISHRWGGPLAMPRDLSPSVLVDYSSGLASAGGYTGDGVVMSYLAANCLADLICTPGADSAFTTLPFVHHRSKRWEVEPLRWTGINVGLGLAAWADRVERRKNKESRASHLLDRLFNQFPP
ncbi:MAG: NAD(P)/FAD-dependent oxidoreductase [Acidimicrobiales bacterium]